MHSPAQKTRFVVALDADNVLFDFDGHWQRQAETVLERSVPQVSGAYHLRARYGLTSAEYKAVWNHFNHEVHWTNIPLLKHARPLVDTLEDMGGQVFVVTSLRERFLKARINALAGVIPKQRIIAVRPAQDVPAQKAQVLRELGAVAMLEDHIENANVIAENIPLSVLLDRHYSDLPSPAENVPVITDAMTYAALVEAQLYYV